MSEADKLEAFKARLLALVDEYAIADAELYSACLDAVLDVWLNEMRQATQGDVLATMHALMAGLGRSGIRSAAVSTSPDVVAAAAGADTKARMN